VRLHAVDSGVSVAILTTQFYLTPVRFLIDPTCRNLTFARTLVENVTM